MITTAVVGAEANAVVAKSKPKDRVAAQVKAKKANTAGTTNALKASGKLFGFYENAGKLKKPEKVSAKK